MVSVKTVLLTIVILFCFVTCGDCLDSGAVEARGKKKKIAYFVYFADLVLKKFFIIKLIYAFVFWVVLHKAGYFLAWFASYLKEQKRNEHHHEYQPHHYEYHDHGHGYGPYRRKNQGY